jgi:hypothetical protein
MSSNTNYTDKYNAYLDRTVENIITEVSDKPAIMSNIMRAFVRNEIKTFMNSVEILLSQMRIDTINNTLPNSISGSNGSTNRTTAAIDIFADNIVITKQNYDKTKKIISIPSNEVFDPIDSDLENNLENDIEFVKNINKNTDNNIDDIGDFGDIDEEIGYIDDEYEVKIDNIDEFTFDNEYVDDEGENVNIFNNVNNVKNVKNICLDSSLLSSQSVQSINFKGNRQSRRKIPEKMD